MADEEPVDQKRLLEEGCKPKCVKQLHLYEACVKRIQGDESGHKHCTGQYFDYWSCIDKCVAPSLFSKLK
ncbi:cytochrome b-c1 complex subunit 6-like [Durio zibethinus]|uniref:Cytochrome b-c1 complex subunit 6 n=1 Tax=Durio zibethinus TaxID=66656 RepID=A0A6P6ADI3_DURZI|nr:cytochrome b-c1 complex subunit 6-like [Durio zibethinus]